MSASNLSLEELSQLGHKIYFEELKDVLEKDYFGQYAVIDVEQKNIRSTPIVWLPS